jgi:hypothetical protein
MLNLEQVETLSQIVRNAIKKKGNDFYAWRNSPKIKEGKFVHSTGWGDDEKIIGIEPDEAIKVFEEKLNGAYGERFVLSIAVAIAAVKKGKEVSLLQIPEEKGTAFDPEGWLVLGIEGHPIFHIAPWDLPLQEVYNSGLISVIQPGSDEAKKWEWKNTTKVDELCFILDISIE